MIRSAVMAMAGLTVTLAGAACGTAGMPGGAPSASAVSPASGSATSAAASSVASSGVSAPGAQPGFGVVSMTFVSASRGFALGSVACGSGRCGALLGTADGGVHWRRLTAPTRALGSEYGICDYGRPCVGQIRFATPAIGYAFSPALLMTTDGGLHWRLLARTGVTSLETASGTVVRVAARYEGCSGRPYRVESARAGTDSWRVLPASAIGRICPPILYRSGVRVVLVSYGNQTAGIPAKAQIERSADAGTTFRRPERRDDHLPAGRRHPHPAPRAGRCPAPAPGSADGRRWPFLVNLAPADGVRRSGPGRLPGPADRSRRSGRHRVGNPRRRPDLARRPFHVRLAGHV